MIKTLRFRLIAAAMISLFTVLAVVITAVNVFNYRSITAGADNTLSLLAAGDGRFPVKGDRPLGEISPGGMRPISPELPFSSRFFSVTLSPDGQVLVADTAHIAAIDRANAVSMAHRIWQKGKEKGFSQTYRYIVLEKENTTQIIFLDCAQDLYTFRTFFIASYGISLFGCGAVLILMLFLSHRIIRPISESYEKQKQFITDAGHELKTPLTIIDADAEVLEMELADNEWLQDIRKQVKRMGGLTNDLIYLSRMQEENTVLKRLPFPLSDVVAETAASFQAPAKTQGKQVLLQIQPLLSLTGDEKAIRQLINILMDNAVKYTVHGGFIQLSLFHQGKYAVLQVTNTTAGIDPKDLPRFFDRFYRTDRSRNSQTGGHGIGLSIAKAIVDAHKGKITACAPDGVSLTVSAYLPL